MPVRLPDPPPAAQLREIAIRDQGVPHNRARRGVVAWNEFREHGPYLRFDPQPPPAGQHDGVGIWYGANTPTIALAEAFQGDRTIDRRRGQPYLTGLRFTRPLHLIGSLGMPLMRMSAPFEVVADEGIVLSESLVQHAAQTVDIGCQVDISLL